MNQDNQKRARREKIHAMLKQPNLTPPERKSLLAHDRPQRAEQPKPATTEYIAFNENTLRGRATLGEEREGGPIEFKDGTFATDREEDAKYLEGVPGVVVQRV